ncbi:MAG: hypothetical protein U0174_02120 [Polyangiaceae bacterium]
MSLVRPVRCAILALVALVLLPAGVARAEECVERPFGPAERPKMTESSPAAGFAGYVVHFRVTLEHGPGERAIIPAAPEDVPMKTAGFGMPRPDAGAGIVITRAGDERSSVIDIPIVLLPREAGTVTQTLPSFGIKLARASGEVVTLCTAPHPIVVRDPTASTAHAMPHPNPPPIREREEWEALKDALKVVGIAAVAALATALAIRSWRKRPKPVPPPPKPIPPWEVASKELAELRSGPLVTLQRYAEFADAATDILRRYIGARYGFDGLESTSDEIDVLLRDKAVSEAIRKRTRDALATADLAKFARASIGKSDCESLANAIYQLVKDTTPDQTLALQKAAAARRGA